MQPLDPDTELEIWPDFPESEISSGARSSRGHRWVDDQSTGLTIGIWEAEPNLGRWMKWPVHEFMVVLEGEVVMVEDDRETVVKKGECFFIPKGRRCIWNQAVYFKKLMMMFDDRSGADADERQPIRKVGPDETSAECFRDPTGRFTVGLRRMDSGPLKFPSADTTELVYLLTGDMTHIGENGKTMPLRAGEAYLSTPGSTGSWTLSGPARTVYCSFRAGRLGASQHELMR